MTSKQNLVPVAIHLLLGILLGLASWGEYSSPAVSLALPLFWAVAPSRISAFSLSFAYQLTVVRFLPPFAGVWFDSLALGVLAWIGQGLLGASTWALLWPKTKAPLTVALWTLAVLVLSVALPWASVVCAGNPVVGLGYLLPRFGWIGIGLYLIAVPAAAGALIKASSTNFKWARFAHLVAPASALVIAIGLGIVGDKLDASDSGRGRVAGRIGAIHTEWGKFPADDLEVITRIDRIGKIVRGLAGGSDGIDTVVFPETIIGLYEVGTAGVMKGSVLINAASAGQTVVVGADVPLGGGRYQNVAIIYRPDGTSSYIAARQTPPIATWAPWLKDGHFPADWTSTSTAAVGGGIKARFMFCFEEYMPLLHLISEAREEHQLVIAMSNGWGSRNSLNSAIQSGHTEGMAKLFGKTWIRAENRALPPKQAGEGAKSGGGGV